MVILARPRRAPSLAGLAAHLLVVAAMLLGSLELHSAGEPLAGTQAASWTAHPQAGGCAGPGTLHVDNAGASARHDCPSCLHRLQTGGSALAVVPGIVPLPTIAALGMPAPRGRSDREPHALPARGPPSIPS
jgi:hypothetical protein